MPVKIQIIALLFSFIYGALISNIIFLHNRIIKPQKRIYRSLMTILLMYNIVLIYIIVLFKINKGIFHLYFLIMLTLGCIANFALKKKLLKNVKYRDFIAKIKNKCYTKTK